MASDDFGRPLDEERGINVRSPLLYNAVESQDRVPVRIARRLYVPHFLRTWNSCVFEFGALLYLATVFPGTLLPMSVYALMRGLFAILFAPAVGQYVHIGNRLQVVRVSIGKPSAPSPCVLTDNPQILQRLVVAASCVIFYILAIGLPLGRGGKTGILLIGNSGSSPVSRHCRQ